MQVYASVRKSRQHQHQHHWPQPLVTTVMQHSTASRDEIVGDHRWSVITAPMIVIVFLMFLKWSSLQTKNENGLDFVVDLSVSDMSLTVIQLIQINVELTFEAIDCMELHGSRIPLNTFH